MAKAIEKGTVQFVYYEMEDGTYEIWTEKCVGFDDKMQPKWEDIEHLDTKPTASEAEKRAKQLLSNYKQRKKKAK